MSVGKCKVAFIVHPSNGDCSVQPMDMLRLTLYNMFHKAIIDKCFINEWLRGNNIVMGKKKGFCNFIHKSILSHPQLVDSVSKTQQVVFTENVFQSSQMCVLADR